MSNSVLLSTTFAFCLLTMGALHVPRLHFLRQAVRVVQSSVDSTVSVDYTAEHFRKDKTNRRIHLTPKEYEVLIHLKDGKTNEQISVALAIHPSTVQGYIQSMYRKVRTCGRKALVKWGKQSGWL